MACFLLLSKFAPMRRGNRFGSGALVFTPLVNTLMEKFSEMPTYLGTTDQVCYAV